MINAVMISIHPKYCEMIANGRKTIEVRKTKPKLNTPFKCYIYCTDCRSYFRATEHMAFGDDELYRDENRNIKYGCSIELMCAENYDSSYFLNKKVIGEFMCDEIFEWHCGYDSQYDANCLIAMTCLSYGELYAYGHGKTLYGWHISDLKIYDTPKELSEFFKPCQFDEDCVACSHWFTDGSHAFCDLEKPITRPPQSWYYVEGLKR